MNFKHKHIFSFFCVFFLFVIFYPHFAFSFSKDDIKHYILENGLEIYFLKDESSPVIHLELDIKAGFSRQTEKNAGYFSFYAKLKNAEAGEDVVKFKKISSPGEVEKNILELSENFHPVHLSDLELKNLISQEKDFLEKYYAEPAGFINSAIESKLFPNAPWKRANGAVPSLFNAEKVSQSRAILDSVAENYYTPDNSVFFVSGNITENTVLELSKKYFGAYQAKRKNKNEAIQVADDKKSPESRRFVIYDKNFSTEITQICVQYQNLEKTQTEVLSEIWNENESVFKKTLLKQRNLKILGAEYIDVSSAVDSMGSRLIIQSLLGSTKVGPVVQADLFLSKSREDDEISDEMISSSIKKRKTENLRNYENSSVLMENFADFIIACDDDDKAGAFFNQSAELGKLMANNLFESVISEEPFVFVLVNSDIYQRNAKSFNNAGYKALSSKNSLWFNQNEYKNLFSNKNGQDENLSESVQKEILDSADRFIKKSESELTVLSLENEIPLILKKNENSSQVEISLIIAGGDLLFADETPGLASVLAGSIMENIRSQLDLFAANGAVPRNSYALKSETFSTHSSIDLILDAKDLNFAVQAMYTALIFCDITPATADMVTYSERTKWRLKTGTMEFQLLCDAIRILYDETKYPNLFEDEKDKPNEMNFEKILAAYPALLDATRFSFVVTGGFSDQGKILSYLNSTFGTLETHPENRIYQTGLPRVNIKETEKKVALRHLFLTDIPKEKAGKMPAVLIPTTKFLDPALYCFSSPDLSSSDASLFNALLLEIGEKMNNKAAAAGSESKVAVNLPEIDAPFARIIVTKIEHTQGAEKIYRESLDELKNEFKNQLELKTPNVLDLEKNPLLARLENNWIMNVLPEAGTNEGAAELVKLSFLEGNPTLYLEQYKTLDKASLEDYYLILESFFPEKPLMRLYSKDSKK